MLPAGAAAQLYEPLHLVAGGSVAYDSNVFRLPPSADPQVQLGSPHKSDTLRTGFVGLRLDKSYSLQRFQVDLTGTAYRYNRFKLLDFDAFDYRAAWTWQFTPRVTGNLSAEQRQALVPFSEFQEFERNVRTAENRLFSLDWWVTGGWHLLLGASQSEQRSSIPVLAEADFRFTRGEAGVRYAARSGSSIAALARVGDGRYLNRPVDFVARIDNEFRQEEAELQMTWVASGRSQLSSRLTWTERKHEVFAFRDSSGYSGQVAHAWSITDKLRLDTSVTRSLVPYFDGLVSHRVDDILSLAASWQATARTAVRLRLEGGDSEFRAASEGVGPRHDSAARAELALDWLPHRSVTVNAALRREARSSTDPTLEYETKVARLGVTLRF
jgi:exopolysaccharide biosynthesis operon protein EpsL